MTSPSDTKPSTQARKCGRRCDRGAWTWHIHVDNSVPDATRCALSRLNASVLFVEHDSRAPRGLAPLWRYEHLFGTEKPDCVTAVIDADVVLAGPLADWLTRFNETTSGPAAMLLRPFYSFTSFATAIVACAAAFRPYKLPLLHQYDSDHAAKLLEAFESVNADTPEGIVRDIWYGFDEWFLTYLVIPHFIRDMVDIEWHEDCMTTLLPCPRRTLRSTVRRLGMYGIGLDGLVLDVGDNNCRDSARLYMSRVYFRLCPSTNQRLNTAIAATQKKYHVLLTQQGKHIHEEWFNLELDVVR